MIAHISMLRGRRSPQTMFLINKRDKLLIEACRFFPGTSDREAARRLRTALLRYQTSRWRRTRTELGCPHDADRLDALLWMILRVRDHVPSEMTIRRALAYS